MKVLEGMPVRTWEYAPVVVPEVARQLVVGLGEVPQQVPRAEMAAGEPREVTLAPRVAPEVVMEVAVGLPRVGTELVAQIEPFQTVPDIQVAVAVLWSSRLPLL